jgi:hypothetical protein
VTQRPGGGVQIAQSRSVREEAAAAARPARREAEGHIQSLFAQVSRFRVSD